MGMPTSQKWFTEGFVEKKRCVLNYFPDWCGQEKAKELEPPCRAE